jgi:hypothetical protein
MDKATAERLMAIYRRAGLLPGEADPLLRALPEPERGAHLRALAGIYGALWETLMKPVVRACPGLDPGSRSWTPRICRRSWRAGWHPIWTAARTSSPCGAGRAEPAFRRTPGQPGYAAASPQGCSTRSCSSGSASLYSWTTVEVRVP